MAIEGVLFDIDGTLVNGNEFYVRAWEEASLKAPLSDPLAGTP
jgi:beta-phosphoglucomutase-like phosphatase (HAD superfamily)